jgi:hypothetical protein
MPDRLFTPEQVDALIPKLADLAETLIDRHRKARELASALGEEQERIRATGGGLIDQRDWKARLERLDGLRIEIEAAIKAIGELGGVAKDLEMGLVDFPGLVPEANGDTPVNLCWKYGEDAVRFWHGFDEGYAQRKPLP